MRFWIVLMGMGVLAGGWLSSPGWANSSHEKLAAMSELDRSEALALVVRGSGHACRTVARTFYQGRDSKGNAIWNLECSGGGSYVVQIKNDAIGSTVVLSCRRLQAASGGICFTKLD